MIYDLFVIGAGSGGTRAARIAASYGAKVAIAEDLRLGGTCVNVGCVPKKLYHYATAFAKQAQLAKAYGWQVEVGALDWSSFHAAKDDEIQRLNGIYQNLIESSGCDIIRGFAKILDPETVQVDGISYKTKRILIATGSTPTMPDIEGVEHCIDSDRFFELTRLPAKLLVVGGGYIGCELGSIIAQLGVEVTIAARSSILKEFDKDAVELLKNHLIKDGISLVEGSAPKTISATAEKTDGLTAVRVEFNDGTQADYDAVLMATGRAPKLDGIGLENTKIQQNENGTIVVDDNYQTHEPNIYAVGDVIPVMQLTPVAIEQGMFLAKLLFSNQKNIIKANFEQIPTAIFTHPQLATVGLTEDEVVSKGIAADIYTSTFRHIKYTVTDIVKKTYIKLIIEQGSDKILGIHMVGDEVGEIMQGFGALVANGGTKAELDRTIGIHPTVAEELVTMREPTRQV